MGLPLQPAMFPDLEGPDFVKSSEVADVAEEVLERHGRVGGVGRLHPVAQAIRDEELSVLWLLNCKPFDPEKDEEGHDTAGKCVKAPGLWHDVTGYHVAIWIREYFWSRWDADTRRAAVLHELLHVEVKRDKDEQLKVAIRKHDVEDFVDVVRHYGPIFGEGPALVRAAALFRGEPVPLDPKVVGLAHDVVDAVAPEGAREELHRQVNAAAAVEGLRELAESTGTDITITAGGRSATIKGRRSDDEDLRPTGDVNPDALRGEADRSAE